LDSSDDRSPRRTYMEPSQDLDPQAVQRAAERLWRQRWPEKVGHQFGQEWALEVASYDDICGCWGCAKRSS